MDFLKPGENTLILERGVKNRWRWAWLEERGQDGKLLGSWCKKLSEPGACFCVVCHKKLLYATSGKKTLVRHDVDKAHRSAVRSLQHTSTLPGATSMANTPASFTDRICEQKIRLCAFIAEHDLSFTVSQPLVQLCRKLAEDKTALGQLSMSNSNASYLSTHGLAPQFKKLLSDKLQNTMFSLNIDESTNCNVDRILHVLVRYFDNDSQKVITQHLASKKVNITTSIILMDTLSCILTSNNLVWDQVVSLLMDNCAVMRGKKGVETLARNENPFLLDISGDTVHMSNAAKALMSPFGTEIQDLCSDIYYDIDRSPKQKDIFSEFQSLLHLPQKSLLRPISSRFLQMLEVCTRVDELMDVLVVYYYHVLPPNEEHKYRWMISQVLQRHAVSVEERARIELLQQQQATASRIGTQANRNRKARISVLFTEYERLRVVIDIFRGIID